MTRSARLTVVGADYLADAAAVAVSLLAIWLIGHQLRADRLPRATAFAALVNGGWLLIVSLLVLAAAARRDCEILLPPPN